MSQQYSLRWNNHQPNFISMFTSLLNTQTLVDVTLTADGQQLLAHKVVLSACSSYFQSLFVENPNPHPIVILKDVTFEDLQTMVDFMYCGVVNVTEEELPRVLETAKLLKIKGLTEMPDSASLTRAPNERNGIEQADSVDSQRASPVPKRKRGKGNITNAMLESCHKVDCSVQTVEPTTITMQYSSGTPRRNNDIVLFDNMSEEGIELIETPPSAPPAPAEPAMAAAPAQLATPVQGPAENTFNRYNTCIGAALQSEGVSYISGVPSSQEMHFVPNVTIAMPSPNVSPGPSNSCSAKSPQLQCIARIVNRRKRKSNPQAEENFQRALEAVRYGGIGFCKAARIFGVNNRTLWLEYKKRGYPNTRPSIRNRIKQRLSPKFKDTECEQEIIAYSQQQQQQQHQQHQQHPPPAEYAEASTSHGFLPAGLQQATMLNLQY